jgi:hypothetical protein
MRRLSLFEFHDAKFCPKFLRDGLTRFLQHFIVSEDIYGPIEPILRQAVSDTKSTLIVDLCAGSGGPWKAWNSEFWRSRTVLCTDLFPPHTTFQREAENIFHLPYSVNATAVPEYLKGFRTLFTAFHHFQPDQARQVIANAVASRAPIGIFEYTSRHGKTLFSMLGNRAALRALRAQTGKSKLFLPVLALLDGLLSCFRSYSLRELQQFAKDSNYDWQVGVQKEGRFPIHYLLGIPKNGTSVPVKSLTV